MPATIDWTKNAREKLHNLNLNIKKHQEYYDIIAEDFLWQNEAYLSKAGERSYKGITHKDGKRIERDVRSVYPDTKGNATVGIGFLMEGEKSKKAWDLIFDGKVSFEEVKAGIRKLTNEEVNFLFKKSIESRREKLKGYFGDNWNKLKPNERLAIEDLYYNGGEGLVIKCNGRETNFFNNIKNYCKNKEKKDLLEAIYEVEHRSNPDRGSGSKGGDGLQARRDAQAEMLSSHKNDVYSKPGEAPIPKNASLKATIGKTIIPRDGYDDCMIEYLRIGTEPTSESFGYKRVEHMYIWRTQLDDKVRKEHYERDGKIFDDRNDPVPPRRCGHKDDPAEPKKDTHGSDYGCRCVADYKIPEWVEVVVDN